MNRIDTDGDKKSLSIKKIGHGVKKCEKFNRKETIKNIHRVEDRWEVTA